MTPSARADLGTLLERLAEGDRTAISPAFDLLMPLLRSFSARALGSETDGEDAAQEAIIKLFAQVSDLDPARDAVAWALTIAAYECRTLRRRTGRRREVSADGIDLRPAGGATPEDLLIERDLQRAALSIVGELRDDDASVIALAISESRPAADATFRKRLQRALGRLRLAWRAKHETE